MRLSPYFEEKIIPTNAVSNTSSQVNFSRWGILAPHPTYKLEYRPLSAVTDRLYNI